MAKQDGMEQHTDESLKRLSGMLPEMHQREGELLRELRLVRAACKLSQRARAELRFRKGEAEHG